MKGKLTNFPFSVIQNHLKWVQRLTQTQIPQDHSSQSIKYNNYNYKRLTHTTDLTLLLEESCIE